jgi:nucleotide-binding universal stress UspA family protein
MLIEELRTSALARGVPSLEPVFLQGDVLPVLLQYLNSHPHDLLIAGSRGLTRGQRFLLGSVSTGLVAEAPCPVLIVRGLRGGAGRHEPLPGRSPSRH